MILGKERFNTKTFQITYKHKVIGKKTTASPHVNIPVLDAKKTFIKNKPAYFY